MKDDLMRLMARDNIDALWISGSAKNNPPMNYLIGNGHISGADVFFKRGEDPVLICNAMEREEAEATGLDVKTYNQYGYRDLIEEHQGNLNKANAVLIKKILSDLEIDNGKIALYGLQEISTSWGKHSILASDIPELTLIGEGPNSILLEARATKDSNEIERIRAMGQITTEVVALVSAYLQSRRVDDQEILLDEDGFPVTIGKVKAKIKMWLMERGAETPEGLIFAIGRDTGIPHNAGNPSDQICLGKMIIFDIFPQESGGGYFFDFTRTWCLGYAPALEDDLYSDVWSVYQKVMDAVELDVNAPALQEITCQYFEELGHNTIRQNSLLESGYVHSLGHGVGLSVHERPRFGQGATESDVLAPGSVVAIEPGLYYPEKGMGCRIEDTIWIRPDGEIEYLAVYPYDLVLPMKYWQGEG